MFSKSPRLSKNSIEKIYYLLDNLEIPYYGIKISRVFNILYETVQNLRQILPQSKPIIYSRT